MIKLFKKVLRASGFELNRIPNHLLKKRMDLLTMYNVNKIFDVGANTGQYATEMREIGFKGEIISFEPIPEIFPVLKNAMRNDSKWTGENFALGDFDGPAPFNVAGDFQSSSLLSILPSVVEFTPDAAVKHETEIQVRKLDSIINQYYNPGEQIFLKLDAQGYEKKILEGAVNSLSKVVGLQLEMSIKQLYSNELTFVEMVPYLKSLGYDLYSVENGFQHPSTGELFQIDGLFFKTNPQ